MNDNDPVHVKRVLTFDGNIPEGYAFLVDAVIYVWNPSFHFQRLRVSSAGLERACIEHLRQSKRVYDSLDEAKEVVIAEQWLNWEKAALPYEDNAYFPEQS